ncbi:Tuftelin [Bienertia sinuspersici]
MLDVINPLEVLGHHVGRVESNSFRLSVDKGASTIMLSSSPTVAMGHMLDVMNPLEVLGHHAGRTESNTFRLSLDKGASTIMLSSSPTVVMGQHAGRDEPIEVDREDDLPKLGTCLAVRPSLLHPSNRAESLVNSQNFLKNMSTVVKLDNIDAYVLHNMMPDRDATNDKPPLLGRSIMLLGYWEWTEDVLSRYVDILELCSVRDAVYASLYSYDRDTNILRAVYESWCPSTNTFHTMVGELSISLWNLYKLGGLPISGRIYDEAVPDIHTLRAHTDKGVRRIPKAYKPILAANHQIVQRLESKKGVSAQQWVDFWCKRSISYSAPVKRKRYTNAPPKSTHNPSGKLTEWQFGFCQDIPSAITRKVQDRSNVSYEKVLMFWKLLLFQAVESSSPNLKRVSSHDEARDAHRSADGHASQHEGTGEDKSTSDVESEINFKHQRGRRSKKPRTADLEGDETDFRNAFENIPIASDISIDLTQVGDMDLEMGASFNVDGAMIEEATEPLKVLTDRPNPGKGKDIHMERDLVERSNPASPVQTHHSVDGPSTFEINAKTLGIPHDAKGIPRAPSHGDAVPAPPISTIRVTLASQGIFTSAIRILGNEYLTLLKQIPFDKVSDRHGEAPQVYKAIQVMHGDPEPLKLEEERLAIEELRLAESSYGTTLTKHKGVEEEGAAVKKKEDELLKELEDVRQRMDQVANALGDNRNSLTTLEATVHAMKRRVKELEANLLGSAEEMELFEEQERKLLEFQSSFDSSELIV